MSQIIPITTHLTPVIVTAIETNVAAAKVISSGIAIAMNPTQTKGLLKIGPQRSAEMSGIYTKLLKPYPVTIPVDYTLATYEEMQQELADSLAMEALYLAQASAYRNHAEIVGNNLFLMNIEGLDNGRQLAKSVPAIAEIVNEISTEFFPHTAASGATIYSLAAGMILVVMNLITGKRIINDGNTIITMLVKNGGGASTITINPGASALVPSGWKNVTITNLSATVAGSFQVFIS